MSHRSQRMSEVTFGGISAQINKSLARPESEIKGSNKNHNDVTFIQRAFICDILIIHCFLGHLIKSALLTMVSIRSSRLWIKYIYRFNRSRQCRNQPTKTPQFLCYGFLIFHFCITSGQLGKNYTEYKITSNDTNFVDHQCNYTYS